MDFSVKIEGLDKLQQSSRIIQARAKNEIEKALFASAKLVEKEAKVSILKGGKSGRIYNRRSKGRIIGTAIRFENGKAVSEGGFRRGFHRASAPGEAPASDTGRLVNSIFSRLNRVAGGLESFVYIPASTVKYARWLEFGTVKMKPRPFFFPALEKSKEWIRNRLAQAVRTALEGK